MTRAPKAGALWQRGRVGRAMGVEGELRGEGTLVCLWSIHADVCRKHHNIIK